MRNSLALNINRLFFLLTAAVFVLSGCAEKSRNTLGEPIFKNAYQSVKAVKPEAAFMDDQLDNNTTENGQPKKMIEIVPDFMRTSEAKVQNGDSGIKASVVLPKGDVMISANEMSIKEFAALAFGEVLNLGFTLDESVQNMRNNVTLKMKEPVNSKDFLAIVVELMMRNNINVRFSDNIVVLEKRSRPYMPRDYPSLIVGSDLSDMNPQQFVSIVVPLRYITVSGYSNAIISIALSAEGQLMPVRDSNAVVITDMAINVQRALALIKFFDRPFMAEMKTRLFYLENVSSSNILHDLEEVLKETGIPLKTKASENGMSIIGLNSINAFFVISPEERWLESVSYWIQKLDKLDISSREERLFIYKPKNRDAKGLKAVLESFLDADSLKKNPAVSSTANTSLADAAVINKGTASEGSVSSAEIALGTLQFTVTVDEDRNTLLFYAKPADFKQIKDVLEQLDILPRQVLVEVTVAEVTLTDSLQYGVEWYLKHDSDFTGTLQTLGGLNLGGSGLAYSAINNSGKFRLALNAFAEKKLINILSTPHILVLDNHEANINVGTEVPVVTSENTASDLSSDASILRSIQYRNTGVNLSVRPVISSEGILTLEITQEVSEAQTNSTSNIDSPLILNRSINTSVMLKNGESVLLGGLISENKSVTKDKVPLLGDIPLFGNLFKVNSTGITKTELIMQITPYILDNTEDISAITNKFKESFRLIGNE
jgi:general secretion pathway protein D